MIRFFSMLFVVLVAGRTSAQWTSMNGPDGGTITAMANAGSYLICGAEDGDMFTSTDNGVTWVQRGNVPGLLYHLAAGNGLLLAASSTGVHRSTDGGTTWTLKLSPLSRNIFVSGSDALAATAFGLFRSTDGGDSWSDITTNLPDSSVYAALIHGANLFASVEDSAVYKSTNNGASWFPTWTDPTRLNLGFLVSDGVKLYAAGSGEARVFSSSNNGASWSSSDLIAGSSSFESVLNLAVTPSGIYAPVVYQSSIFTPINAGIFMSSNGSSWNLLSSGLVPRYVRSLMLVGTDLLAGTQGGGMFRSSNGGTTWARSTSGIVKSRITHLSFLNNGVDFYAGVHGGGFATSTDSGHTWVARNSGLDATVFPILTGFVSKGTSWFIGTDGDGIFRTTNNGAQWTSTSLGQGNNSVSGVAVRGTELIATAIGVDGVFRSTNDGSSWSQIMSNFTTFGANCVAIGGAGTIFVGTMDQGVLRSTNNGGTWLSSTSLGGIPTFLRFVGTKMFAGTDNGPFRSTDFGVTWQPSNTGLSGITVNFIAIRDTNTLFASTNGSGVYLSSNSGGSWTPMNTGLPTFYTTSVRVTGSYVYCGTVYHGVWRRALTDFLTDVRESDLALPGEFALLQNYPNPFNPSTRIVYTLPNANHVDLTVYNTLGQVVRTLVNAEMKGGRHSVTLDASELASGVYFYQLRARDFVQTRKLILLR